MISRRRVAVAMTAGAVGPSGAGRASALARGRTSAVPVGEAPSSGSASLGVPLGAAFLALDFEQIEDGIAYGAPRDDSWFAAFGLTTTLVWIYLEGLRVLSILQSDN